MFVFANCGNRKCWETEHWLSTTCNQISLLAANCFLHSSEFLSKNKLLSECLCSIRRQPSAMRRNESWRRRFDKPLVFADWVVAEWWDSIVITLDSVKASAPFRKNGSKREHCTTNGLGWIIFSLLCLCGTRINLRNRTKAGRFLKQFGFMELSTENSHVKWFDWKKARKRSKSPPKKSIN